MIYFLCFFSILLIIFTNINTSYTLDQNKMMSQYIHTVYQIEDGLPQNSIQCILQTRDGYIWLGTQEGLVRFDGLNFKIFDTYNTQGILHNSIWCLYEDRSGNLWIGTQGGGITKYKDGKFSYYNTENGLSNDIVLSILEDRNGVLWIGTSGGGLNQYKNGKFINITTKEGLSSDMVLSIIEDRSGVIWIGTRGGGLNQFKDGKFTHYTIKDGLSNDIVRCIYEDRSSVLWIGTQGGGLNQFKDGKFTHYTTNEGLSNNMVYSIYEDRSGVLWIGTRGGGLNQFKNGNITHFTTKDGLSHNMVYSIYEDRNDILWIGTVGGGLNQFKDGKFSFYTSKEGLSNDQVFSIFEDKKGGLWIGTQGGGLNYYKDGKFSHFTTKDGLSNDMINSIYEDHNGVIWIGTRSDGLNRLKDGKFTHYSTKEGLSSNQVLSIYEDHNFNLWIGTYGGGVNKFKDDKFSHYTTSDGLSSDLILCVYEDRGGTLWIGTQGGGVTSYKDDKFTQYTTKEGLSNDLINCIYEDRRGDLWIGTQGGGLNRFKNGKFTYYTSNEGLIDNNVFWLQEDNNNNFWMTSNKGIFRVCIEEFNKNDKDRYYKIKSLRFGLNDGLLTQECNAGSTPAGWISVKESTNGEIDGVRNFAGRTGNVKRLYFPTIKGVAFIDPDNIKINNLEPPVYIEYILINNQLMLMENQQKDNEGQIILDNEQNKIFFKFTACEFGFPKAVKFKYMLEEYDTDWLEAPYDARTKEYTNLSPGYYKFKVIACNNDGFWNEQGDSISFYIKPAYYQTYWFISFYILVFLIIVYFIIKIRIAKYKKQNKILFNAKQKAEEGERIKTEFLNNVSHELITPLSGIMGYAELMLISDFSKEESDTMLTQIHSLGENLLQLLRDVISFSHPDSSYTQNVKSKFKISNLFEEIKLRFISEIENKNLTFNVFIESVIPDEINADHNKLKQVIVNLMGNAIKFTNIGSIELGMKMYLHNNEMCYLFYVKDTGIGIENNKLKQVFNPFFQVDGTISRKYNGTGLGLTISKKLVELLGGQLWVESEVNKGSTFYFYIK